ncbi:hypothetical protein SUGI_1196490 [Cryptomeria japonica]|nr:hypothetical protein SUGI_1196490 [Cryptomeria japonica]
MGDHPLFLQPWNPNLDPTKLRPYEEPLWIWLYNLPIEYWGDECLEKIGRTLGTLIDIDWDILESDLEKARTHFDKDCNSKVKTKEMWQCKKTFCTPAIVGLIEGPKNEAVPWVTDITPPSVADPNSRATGLGTSILDIPCQISTLVEGIEGAEETRMRNHSDNCSPPPDDLEAPSSSSNLEEFGDQLDIIEDRCISQSACQFLDKGKVKTLKKSRGRKTLRQLRKEEAATKGFTSIFKFLSTKGGNSSLGK